ncbi:uncharacterized protein LOC134282100 isoform X2 [Saccostrea cucullata]|uniref:uncharacterized protein LOC134282100 isoform X2 n=1 Tax=Saccostrea cuccullata TaxID=36930 RepID=UPI002ED5BC75
MKMLYFLILNAVRFIQESCDHPSSYVMDNVEVCRVGIAKPCTQVIHISVKNCSTYMVYRLPPVDCCNSAYCFESPTGCKSDASMDPSVENYNISWVIETRGNISRYDPRLNFICRFTPLTDESLFYDISWYVDDIEVIKGQTVNLSTMENALLPVMTILENNKTAGLMIQCVVGIKLTANGSPCVTNASQPFFAGIKVLTPQLFIDLGGKANIHLQLTIPYADSNFMFNGHYTEANDLSVIAYIPAHSSLYCENSPFQKDFIQRRCKIRIKSYSYKERAKYETNVWKQVYKMTIFEHGNAFSNLSMLERGITLQLKTMTTTGEGSRIFSRIDLQDILVYSNQTSSIQSMSTTTVPIQDCATMSTPPTFPQTTMTSNILTTPSIASPTHNSLRTTTQSKMNANATISDCLGINKNNSVVFNSKENCDLLVTSTSEEFTVPGNVFIVVVSVLVAFIVLVLLIWRWRLRSSRCKKSESRNGNFDGSCKENQSSADRESTEGKHSWDLYENSEQSLGQTTKENEDTYTNITELEESIPKNNSHGNENFYQKLGDLETRFYEQLGENNLNLYEHLEGNETRLYEQLAKNKQCF